MQQHANTVVKPSVLPLEWLNHRWLRYEINSFFFRRFVVGQIDVAITMIECLLESVMTFW